MVQNSRELKWRTSYLILTTFYLIYSIQPAGNSAWKYGRKVGSCWNQKEKERDIRLKAIEDRGSEQKRTDSGRERDFLRKIQVPNFFPTVLCFFLPLSFQERILDQKSEREGNKKLELRKGKRKGRNDFKPLRLWKGLTLDPWSLWFPGRSRLLFFPTLQWPRVNWRGVNFLSMAERLFCGRND